MTNTETSIVTAAITAAIVGGAVVYLLRPRKFTGLADEHHALIYLDMDNGKCTSFTFPPRGTVKKNGQVKWHVVATKDGKKCLDNNRKLKLIEKEPGSSPLDPAEPSGSTIIQAKAIKKTEKGEPYGYEVWIVEENGSKVERIEDPELEVVDVL